MDHRGDRAELGRQLAVGALGGALVVLATSPAFWQTARRFLVLTLARGITVSRALGRLAEEARLEAEDLLAEAQAVAGPAPTPPSTEERPSAHEAGGHAH
jgi:hypothetical protein